MNRPMINREALYERQNIDCNCNDCHFFERDIEAWNRSNGFHLRYQIRLYRTYKAQLTKRAEEHRENGDYDKALQVEKFRDSLRFQFSYESGLVFGKCGRFNKDISFIPNVCQLETQGCFEHRIDYWDEEKKQKWFKQTKDKRNESRTNV